MSDQIEKYCDMLLGINVADFEETAFKLLPRIKEDAAILLAHWPTAAEVGVLPCSGKYWGDDDGTGHISVHGNTVGPCIWKAERGGLRFDIGTVGTKLEYHPPSQQPTSFKTFILFRGKREPVEHILEKWLPLEPEWFLAWYALKEH